MYIQTNKQTNKQITQITKDVYAMCKDQANPQWMDYAVEFCGGTHVIESGDIKSFTVVSDNAKESGVRRLVCVTSDLCQEAYDCAFAYKKRLTTLEKVRFMLYTYSHAFAYAYI